MTIKELIKELKMYDENTIVMISVGLRIEKLEMIQYEYDVDDDKHEIHLCD